MLNENQSIDIIKNPSLTQLSILLGIDTGKQSYTTGSFAMPRLAAQCSQCFTIYGSLCS